MGAGKAALRCATSTAPPAAAVVSTSNQHTAICIKCGVILGLNVTCRQGRRHSPLVEAWVTRP